ncbi:MAG: hypothetical protein ABFS05_03070 [Bacteroidota bacterium]
MKVHNFICPKCRSQLVPNTKIVLLAKLQDGSQGLLLLSPILGEYSATTHAAFNVNEGDKVDIFCPVCHEDLGDYNDHKNLARVIMIDDREEEYDIVFSEIIGQQCTYKIHGEEVEKYGEEADLYTNFWGVAPRY